MSEERPTAIRFATVNDRKALWCWRRDAVHLDLHQGGAISLALHSVWFEALLRDESRLLLVGWRDSVRVGAVILRETADGHWNTQVIVKPSYLGRGVESAMLLGTPAFLAGMVSSRRGRGVNLNGLADHIPAAEHDAQFQGGG